MVCRFSPVSVSELVKETTSSTKWKRPASSTRPRWCSARWTSRQERVFALRFRRSPWRNTSVTCRSRTFSSSSTTSSDSRRPVQRCRPFSVVCHRPWVTSPTSPTRWESSRSASPRRVATRSRHSRQFMCPPMTTPTPRRQQPSPTSTPRPSFRVKLRRRVSTRPLTH